MRRIVLFVEDYGHEEVITALLKRLAKESGIEVQPIPRSVRGGHGKVITEFKAYLRDLESKKEDLPDLLIVATDANCKGYTERLKEIEKLNEQYKNFTIYAIPDPHIERWLLIDSYAFKAVLGKGCKAPDQKCSRDRYKKLLMEAMKNAGIVPPLGGMEYARDIVHSMDFQKSTHADASFEKFLKALQGKFIEWNS